MERLLDILPSSFYSNYVNPNSVKTLYSIWDNEKNKIEKNIFRKPTHLGSMQLKQLESEGLIESMGDKIKVTSKGENIIKIMVLGDDNSIFDKSGSLSYDQALRNTKNAHSNNHKKIAQNWWSRFEND